MSYLVNTPCGQLQGKAGDRAGTAAYLGIRYATAGRWEYPSMVTSWEGIYDATAFGYACIQSKTFFGESGFYTNEFRKGQIFRFSEDCLFLNIWTPDTAQPGDNLPVMVYIHGGGFGGGSSDERQFDSPAWPEQNVIAVTINYRLGPLGFLALEALQQEAGHTGNYGLYDQMTALKWLQTNIASFGGDPDNVTILGQSAGAMSVQQLILSPLTEGLFHKAVLISGGGIHPRYTPRDLKTLCDFGRTVMEKAGCQTLAQLRALPLETFFRAWRDCQENLGMRVCFPCMDGHFVDPAAPQKEIPCMIGFTSHDMVPPTLYAIAKDWCANRANPGYLWYFDRMLPGDTCGAWHSADLWYWFGTLHNCWRPWEEKDRILSRQMIGYLTNFAKTGNPNGTDLPQWQPVSKASGLALCMGQKPPRMGRPSVLKLRYLMVEKWFGNKFLGKNTP